MVLAVATIAFPQTARSVTPTINAYNEPGGLYGRHYWEPAADTIGAGGAVKFVNPYPETYHGLKFTGGSAGETPKCTGLPAKAETFEGALGRWEGECTFTKPGTYTFVCTVHPEMKGTITVTGTPEANTEAASEPTQTTADLHGSVKPEGNPTQYRFEYGTGSVSEHSTSTFALGAEDFASHSVSTVVSGLLPETTYRVRLTILYGEAHTPLHAPSESEVTTLVALAPAVKAGPVLNPGEREATLKGTVDPEGEATKYRFEYGTVETEYLATTTTTLTADSSVHSVSAPVSGLLPGTEYSYRLVAENGKGTTEASGKFKTASPPSKEPSPEPGPGPTPGPTSPAPSVPLVTAPVPSEPGVSFGAPLVAGSLKLAAHGTSVRGSIGVARSGLGGRLTVQLLAKPAAVGARGSKSVAIARFVRGSASVGTNSFSLPLSSRARLALRKRGRLALSVEVALTPPGGKPEQLTRALTLRR